MTETSGDEPRADKRVRHAGTPPIAGAPRTRWIGIGLVGIWALSVCLPSIAQTPKPASRAPAHIHWQLLVLQDGEQVDQFSGDTAVGQSQTATHHHPVSYPVGCEGAQTAPTDLSRTISVSPLGVDSHDVIGFEISADELIEDGISRAITGSGCALPPQPRTISARHPELDVASGKTSDWVILKNHPQLIYRLEANVIPATY